MKRLYLGGPINGCTDEEANGWRKSVVESLPEFECLDPMRRDYRGRELEPGIADEIVRGDMGDLEGVNVALFNCPKPSVGTAMEIFYAHHVLGKRVYVVHPKDKAPSPWLIRFSDQIFPSVRDACEFLKGWER